MITKILWEMFSVALLLYGLYLIYAFIWFSMYRILDTSVSNAKLVAGIITMIILAFSSYKWFKKKLKEIKKLQEKTET